MRERISDIDIAIENTQIEYTEKKYCQRGKEKKKEEEDGKKERAEKEEREMDEMEENKKKEKKAKGEEEKEGRSGTRDKILNSLAYYMCNWNSMRRGRKKRVVKYLNKYQGEFSNLINIIKLRIQET